MSPRCLSTIGFMWSEATTVGRGSAPWSAWTTRRTRTAFGTPSPPWMFVEASLEPQHSGVSGILCQMTHAFHGVAFLWNPRWMFSSLRKVYNNNTAVVFPFCSISFDSQQTWFMLPVASMAAGVIPAWSDMTQTSTSGACWEICRQLEKEPVWWWPVDLYTV